LLVIRATRVLVAVAFGYPLFGISGEQIMALYESNTWSIGENINTIGDTTGRPKITTHNQLLPMHPIPTLVVWNNPRMRGDYVMSL
jgi:hypothetical protein